MRVELKDAKVEMEVGGGKSFLYINGQRIPLPREVGVALVFGDDTRAKPPTPPTKGPGVVKAKSRHGCQTPGSKEKLSRSLKAYWRKRKAEEKAKVVAKSTTKKHLNGKSHLNGASIHIN